MCGIAGYINLKAPIEKTIFNSMVDSLIHRGPDGWGAFFNEKKTVALGHRRLSFIDLSETGKQPMSNVTSDICITFNGEIYNYKELREELSANYSFKTETDTEVILAAYSTWGANFMHKLKGMFAFGIYDAKCNKLLLVRDRFGIKPLYYFKDEHRLIFASEIKAILASEIVQKEIDFSAFADYFVYRYIPSPKTIWKKIAKVPPATYLEIDTSDLSIKETEYWKIKCSDVKENYENIVQEIDNKLNQSVEEHTRADVPIGSFLSGGYDSSALVYYMKQLHQQPQTFSIGFSKWEKSEDQYAKIVAKHLDVENTSVIADESSLDLLDIMADVYDEPIADISIVPTFLVSKLARQKVKAVLSGEGADEIFAGYTWQQDFMNQQSNKNWFSKLFSKNKSSGDTVLFYAQAMAMGWFDAEELKKMLNPALHQYIPNDVHWFYRSHFKNNLTPLKSIQYLDVKCFMGELVLTKIDRASMANSLEVRVPFLDHTIMEKIFSLCESNYFKTSQTKDLLYQNIKTNLPQQILERKKQGFVGPDTYYMNMDFYKSALKNSLLVQHNIINQEYIDNILKETYNWKLWKILIMEKWYKRWVG
jgi:asparagine synthase (glutamine-hydrolysing)